MWTMEHRILMSSSAFLRGGEKKGEKKRKAKKALRINSKPRSIYVTVTPLRHITRTNNTKKSHRDLFLTRCAGAKLAETTGISSESKLEFKLQGRLS